MPVVVKMLIPSCPEINHVLHASININTPIKVAEMTDGSRSCIFLVGGLLL